MQVVRQFQIITLIVVMSITTPSLSNADAVRLLVDNAFEFQGQRIVLHGVSVPTATAKCLVEEKNWPCGATATLRFNELLEPSSLDCEFIEELENVTLARCRSSGLDIAHQLVSEGWAVAVEGESDYDQAESQARVQGLGIWRGHFSPPNQWRQYPQTNFNPYLDLECSVCAIRKQ